MLCGSTGFPVSPGRRRTEGRKGHLEASVVYLPALLWQIDPIVGLFLATTSVINMIIYMLKRVLVDHQSKLP